MTEPSELRPIPRWVSAAALLVSALGLFVAGALYLKPSAFLTGVDLTAPGATFLVKMWAARQLALAFIVGSATLKRAAPMMHIALVASALMNLQDALIGAWRGDYALTTGATFFTVLTATLALRVRKKALLRR